MTANSQGCPQHLSLHNLTSSKEFIFIILFLSFSIYSRPWLRLVRQVVRVDVMIPTGSGFHWGVAGNVMALQASLSKHVDMPSIHGCECACCRPLVGVRQPGVIGALGW